MKSKELDGRIYFRLSFPTPTQALKNHVPRPADKSGNKYHMTTNKMERAALRRDELPQEKLQQRKKEKKKDRNQQRKLMAKQDRILW